MKSRITIRHIKKGDRVEYDIREGVKFESLLFSGIVFMVRQLVKRQDLKKMKAFRRQLNTWSKQMTQMINEQKTKEASDG
jgi:bifunctional DNA-binding transcriptional regulator/antitoxin component of YhaV-PrlF toxin-antitoxin module